MFLKVDNLESFKKVPGLAPWKPITIRKHSTFLVTTTVLQGQLVLITSHSFPDKDKFFLFRLATSLYITCLIF